MCFFPSCFASVRFTQPSRRFYGQCFLDREMPHSVLPHCKMQFLMAAFPCMPEWGVVQINKDYCPGFTQGYLVKSEPFSHQSELNCQIYLLWAMIHAR